MVWNQKESCYDFGPQIGMEWVAFGCCVFSLAIACQIERKRMSNPLKETKSFKEATCMKQVMPSPFWNKRQTPCAARARYFKCFGSAIERTHVVPHRSYPSICPIRRATTPFDTHNRAPQPSISGWMERCVSSNVVDEKVCKAMSLLERG